MVAKNIVQAVLRLPVEERLDLFQQLRENLLNDPAIDAISEAEKKILSERMANATPDDFSTWEEVDARLLAFVKDEP